jgi:hypothetical protein
VPKQPKFKQQPVTQKKPTAAADGAYYHLRPSWRISILEMAGPYGWHACDLGKLQEIREKLRDFEKSTWGELIMRSNGRHHFIERHKLNGGARARLEAMGQEDIDAVFSLRLTGTERVFGIMEAGVLKVLWWDSDHQVCPARLQHT